MISGLLHPLLGPDHLVAMVAVGLWGAQLGAPAIWLLPIVFPLVMALGGLLGIAGFPLPFFEMGVALSALLLGLAVAAQWRPNLVLSGVLVGVFGIFHGYAHGTELPGASNALAYGIGFVTTTGLLHLTGIVIGILTRWPAGVIAVRACGGGSPWSGSTMCWLRPVCLAEEGPVFSNGDGQIQLKPRGLMSVRVTAPGDEGEQGLSLWIS
ncbi:MAG: HupE/UreJ family protein [Parahaliea sp.]